MNIWSPYALAVRHPRLCRFVFAVLLSCFSPALIAAELECNNINIAIAVGHTFSHERVDTIQGQLIKLGLDIARDDGFWGARTRAALNPDGRDGLWGPRTRAALNNFCLRAKFARNKDLQLMLRNHVAIYSAYPDWQITLASKDFQTWMQSQADSEDIERLRQSGDSFSVIKLLKRYDGREKSSGISAAEPDYMSCISTKGNLKHIQVGDRLNHEKIGNIQKQLFKLGFNPVWLDGTWGPKTKAALNNFCQRAEFARNKDLQLMLRNHVLIHAAYPDWQITLASKDFKTWMQSQFDSEDIERVRQFGDSFSVIKLLKRYDRHEKLSRTSSVELDNVSHMLAKEELKRFDEPVGPPADGLDYVSYMLTKEDLKQLQSKAKVVKLIDKLSAKSYVDNDALEAAARKAFKDMPDATEHVKAMKGFAIQQTSYSLTVKSFEALKVKGVPKYVLNALEALKDLNYPAGEFDKAVDSELSAGLSAKLIELEPEIVVFAEITPTGASMTEASLSDMMKAYSDDLLIAAVSERLVPLQNIIYRNNGALAWAVKKKLMQMHEEINRAKPLIHQAAVTVSESIIKKASADDYISKVKASIVPKIYLELISGLVGVDYPTEELFWHAIEARVNFKDGDNIIMKSITESIAWPNAFKVDDELLAKWKKAELPAAILDPLKKLQGREFDSVESFKKEITKRLVQLYGKYKQYKKSIIAQGRKPHPLNLKESPVQWTGDGNGCLLNSLAGDVYGLYPYWMTGEKKQKQLIDFSVQSRIGYFGVRLDEKGGIANPRHWTQAHSAFIREAHTYCSKVDLVVYKNDWSGWEKLGPVNRALFFKRAANNIAAHVTKPVADTFLWGSEEFSVMGDGVTLYFPGYPQEKEEYIVEFDEFIHRLLEQLRGHGRKYSLNLMFSSAERDKGIYDYSRLLELSRDIEEGGVDSLFLVLLQEPTTRDKKEVRQSVEAGLHGEDRRKLLRNIAMVITYDGSHEKQLVDDVIYAKDNFGGVGFWTLPIMTATEPKPGSNPITTALRTYYLEPGSSVDENSKVCLIVCPNRSMFRIAWGVFGLILLFSLLLYLLRCDCRIFLGKNFIFFIACVVMPFVVITFALLSCDPVWVDISKGNGILVIVIVAILAYSIWKYRYYKSQANLP